ncbi:glycosyltransferase family 2 protein [Granulicella aggregans]|nr:glycosyltransferase [Granulicella aggregans]
MAYRNEEVFLFEAIRSIQEQTFRNWELLLIDDHSDDNSPTIAQRSALSDGRIRLLRSPSYGLVPALNYGCAMATGTYIARLDSDDIAVCSRLEMQVEFLDQNPSVTIVGGHIECIDKDGHLLFTMLWPTLNQGLQDFLLIDCCVSHTTVMMRRQAIINANYYRLTYTHAEDYDLFLRFSDGLHVENMPTVLSQYRLHKKQTSMLHAEQQVISGIAARIATKERRAGRREPFTSTSSITRYDIEQYGISPKRIASGVSRYQDSALSLEQGWRWSSLPFCMVPGR